MCDVGCGQPAAHLTYLRKPVACECMCICIHCTDFSLVLLHLITTHPPRPPHPHPHTPTQQPQPRAHQVDVTAQGEAKDTTAPKWTKTASDEALRVKQGNQAASLISNALQNMGWGASPWAKLQGHIMRTKPHKVRCVRVCWLRAGCCGCHMWVGA